VRADRALGEVVVRERSEETCDLGIALDARGRAQLATALGRLHDRDRPGDGVTREELCERRADPRLVALRVTGRLHLETRVVAAGVGLLRRLRFVEHERGRREHRVTRDRMRERVVQCQPCLRVHRCRRQPQDRESDARSGHHPHAMHSSDV